MQGGVVALDHGDEDHVFRVKVERVLRRQWRPDQPVRIGTVDGVEAEFVGVTVDNFVRVHLTAAHDDGRDRRPREFHDAFERWATATEEKGGELPQEPAHRLMRVRASVSDSAGTSYRPHGGEYGGSDTPWEAIQSFLPGPPDEVRQLHISLHAPTGSPVVISVPLP